MTCYVADLILLLGCFAFDGALFRFLVQRRQLTFLAQNSQKLDDQREIIVLSPDILDLLMKFR